MKNEGTSEKIRPLRADDLADTRADRPADASRGKLVDGTNWQPQTSQDAIDVVNRLRKEAQLANAGILTDVSADKSRGSVQTDISDSARQRSKALDVVAQLKKEAHMANAGILTDVAAGLTGGLPLPRQEEALPQTTQFEIEPVNPVMRALEIVVALVALTLTLPIQLILGLIIWRGTPGPILFRQQRLGVNAENFTFVKFRTFYADAKERFPELYAYKYTKEEMETLRFKVEKDPRVSPQGEWMRKTSLDELPNFWNLLTGEMALVGPRPEIPEMLPYYKGDMLKKFSVRPGITGLAQTSGRGHLSFKDTVALDIEYVKKRSFWFDIKILFNTFVMVALHRGAY
ncbi:MAG: sugar transferase [Gammaproteobacteria bacterium]